MFRRVQLPSGVQDVHEYDEQYDWSDWHAACRNGSSQKYHSEAVFTKKRNYVSTVLAIDHLSNICTDFNESN